MSFIITYPAGTQDALTLPPALGSLSVDVSNTRSQYCHLPGWFSKQKKAKPSARGTAGKVTNPGMPIP